MRKALALLLVAATALTLAGCAGYQTGNGLSRFDSKSFWETDSPEEGGSDSGAAPDSSSPDHGAGAGGSDSGSN